MIKFNRLGRQANFSPSNFFYGSMPPTRQTMFKQAFGLAFAKQPILRYERKDGSPIKDSARNYQEDLISQRQYVQGMLESVATALGAELSQVTHAVVSGNRDAFVKVLLRRIKANIREETIMVWDTSLGENKPQKHYVLDLPQGHKWGGNPLQIDEAEVIKKVTAVWDAAGGIMTDYERAVEGGEEALVKFKTEEASKRSKNYSTSRKDAMKGVQVVNARQKARQAAVVAG